MLIVDQLMILAEDITGRKKDGLCCKGLFLIMGRECKIGKE